QGVAGSKGGLGYFGMAYYENNIDKLRIVPIGSKKVIPTQETVRNGSYSPLSRPLFIYVNTVSAKKPHVAAFVDFYLDHAAALSKEVGYVPLPDAAYVKVKAHWKARSTGTRFTAATTGMTIEQVMAK